MLHVCAKPECRKEFKSKHRPAKYCCRACAASVNIKVNQKLKAISHKQRYTNEDLLDKIRVLAEKLGRPPFYREASNPEAWIYRQRFGTWNNAVIAAGFRPRNVIETNRKPGSWDSLPVRLRFQILTRDNFRCRYCGQGATDGAVLEVDHIVARARGGEHDPDNLVTACRACNQGKSDMEIDPQEIKRLLGLRE